MPSYGAMCGIKSEVSAIAFLKGLFKNIVKYKFGHLVNLWEWLFYYSFVSTTMQYVHLICVSRCFSGQSPSSSSDSWETINLYGLNLRILGCFIFSHKSNKGDIGHLCKCWITFWNTRFSITDSAILRRITPV